MKTQAGFTLIEVLVSMVILSIIVILCGQIFEQSQAAWSGGSRRVEMNMTGRALADYMAQELSQAVEDERYFNYFLLTDNMAQFVMVAGTNGTDRTMRWVEYRLVGNVARRRSGYIRADGYARGWSPSGISMGLNPPPSGNLTPAITAMRFSRPVDDTGDDEDMPPYVDVSVTVVSSADVGSPSGKEQTYTTRAYLANRKRYKYD